MMNLYEEEKAWVEDMKQTEGKLKKAEKPAKYEQIITVSFNKKYNGIELSFRFKPNADERAKLKRAGFKWHYKKMVWYATNNADRLAAVGTLRGTINYPDNMKKSGSQEPDAAEKVAPAVSKKADPIASNKYGVKVGDIFESSWGYDQTNINFFQVVALAGTQSVRVREVYLPMIKSEATCSMAADETFQVVHEILPPVDSSCFIKDQEHGDLKRLKSYNADGISDPQFALSSFADAHLVTEDTITEYHSWYA